MSASWMSARLPRPCVTCARSTVASYVAQALSFLSPADELITGAGPSAPGGLIGQLRDRVARVRAQAAGRGRMEALRESEQHFRSLVQHTPDLLVLVDAAGTPRYVSPAIERVLGYPAGQVAESYDCSLLHPDDLARARRFLVEMVRRPGNTPAVELRVRHRDGSWRYLEVVGNNLLADPSVGSIVFSARDVTERKRLEAELAHRALHDSLTGLPNRVLLMDRLAHALARVGRDGERVAVLFLDLDRFKTVNDRLGHDAGDELLAAVAQRLRGCLRAKDTAARLGGDEFVVLLASLSDAGEAVQVAERIVERLEAPFRVGGHEVRISTSVGIALSQPAEGRPIDLLRAADGAMYRAKARGAGRYALADRDWHPSFAEPLCLASAPYAAE